MHQTQIFDPKKNTFFSEMLHKLNILHWKKPFFQKKSTKKKAAEIRRIRFVTLPLHGRGGYSSDLHGTLVG